MGTYNKHIYENVRLYIIMYVQMHMYACMYKYILTYTHTHTVHYCVFVSLTASNFNMTSTTDSPNGSKYPNSFFLPSKYTLYIAICDVIRCTYAYITWVDRVWCPVAIDYIL